MLAGNDRELHEDQRSCRSYAALRNQGSKTFGHCWFRSHKAIRRSHVSLGFPTLASRRIGELVRHGGIALSAPLSILPPLLADGRTTCRVYYHRLMLQDVRYLQPQNQASCLLCMNVGMRSCTLSKAEDLCFHRS